MSRRHAPAGAAVRPVFGWPAVLFLAVLIGAPTVVIVMYSLLSRTEFGIGVRLPWSTDAYRRLLFDTDFSGNLSLDTRYVGVLGTSVWLSGVTTVVCLLLAVPVAVWIATRPARWRPLLVFVVTIPFWTNTLVRTYALVLVLGDQGPLNRALGSFGVGPLSVLNTDTATLIGLVYTFLPFMILPVYASAEKFDFRLAEAAYDLGARRGTVVRRVLLPALVPGIVGGSALVFIPALGAFLQPDLLGGGKNLMMGSLIQLQFQSGRNWPLGAALSVALLVITMLAVLALLAWNRRGDRRAVLL